MDIFEYAKKFDADYYDPNTGYVFRVQNYNQAKRFGLPNLGIEVVDLDGRPIGWVREEDNVE